MKHLMRAAATSLLVGLASVVVSGMATVQAAEQAVAQSFNIGAQALSSALNEFAKQSKKEISYPPQLVANKKTAGVKGSLEPMAALSELLKNTGLQFSMTPSGAIILTVAEAVGVVGQPAEQMRLADVSAAQGNKATDGEQKPVEQMVVEGEREKRKPFSDANIDLPRTINDVQPYYIFDAQEIRQSGVRSIEEFLKQRLPMNTNAAANSQDYRGGYGDLSSINLRGIGEDRTLVLVNGRRVTSVGVSSNIGFFKKQPNLNAIPLAAIDRIEILPTSASGIYGGGAMGGVVNVILKDKYSGGEINAAYDNVEKGSAPSSNVDATIGRDFSGRTNVLLTISRRNSEPLLLRDRIDFIGQRIDEMRQRAPALFLPVPVGAMPNIMSVDGSALSLKSSGASLGSPIATLPKDYGPTSSSSEIIGNQWNLDRPPTNQPIPAFGLLQPLGAPVNAISYVGSMRHMMRGIELFSELSYAVNSASTYDNPLNLGGAVPGGAVTNPFNQDVSIFAPINYFSKRETESRTRQIAVGARVDIPREWKLHVDYSRSVNEFSFSNGYFDSVAWDADLQSGTLNLFVDTLRIPEIRLDPYVGINRGAARSKEYSGSVRVAGPLLEIRGNPIMAAIAMEIRDEGNGESQSSVLYKRSTTRSSATQFFPKSQSARSGYAELNIPVVSIDNSIVAVKSFEVQLAARMEKYSVSTGTNSKTITYSNPERTNWSPFIPPNGVPYRSSARYDSVNPTVGFKYQPIESLIVRASYATAFVPPTNTQLLQNPTPSSTNVTDPLLMQRYSVQRISGGNSDLIPENSESWNAGLIWNPLESVRANVEFYKITQLDKIGSLSAQEIVNRATMFPGRVIRDSATNRITSVDASLMNLTRYETEGLDINLTYQRAVGGGNLEVNVKGTRILHEKRQLALDLPLIDYVGYPNLNGGEAKNKGNVTLTWHQGQMTLGWATSYYGEYMQSGSPGDPDDLGAFFPDYYLAQGSSRIPAQMYHDLFCGVTWNGTKSKGGRGVSAFAENTSLQVGIKNVFDKSPPADAFYSYLTSPYGDLKLRSYWVSVSKGF